MLVEEVPYPLLHLVWPHVEPMIDRALAHGQGDGSSKTDILQALAQGESTMWAVREGQDILATVIFSVNEYSTGKKLCVDFLAGKKMDLWVETLEELLRDYSLLVGAMCVEASCRTGLAKKLTKRGWKTKAIIMEAPV